MKRRTWLISFYSVPHGFTGSRSWPGTNKEPLQRQIYKPPVSHLDIVMYETSFGVCRSLSPPVSKLALYEAAMALPGSRRPPQALCCSAGWAPSHREAAWGLFFTNMNVTFSLLKVFRVWGDGSVGNSACCVSVRVWVQTPAPQQRLVSIWAWGAALWGAEAEGLRSFCPHSTARFSQGLCLKAESEQDTRLPDLNICADNTHTHTYHT